MQADQNSGFGDLNKKAKKQYPLICECSSFLLLMLDLMIDALREFCKSNFRHVGVSMMVLNHSILGDVCHLKGQPY